MVASDSPWGWIQLLITHYNKESQHDPHIMAATFSVTQPIRRPPEDVFAAITDMDDWSNWMPGFVRLDHLTDGPLDVGKKWREVRKMFGREAEEVFEVTALTAPSGYELFVDGSQGTTGKGEYLFVHSIEPVEGGCHLTIRGEVAMPGLGFKLFGRLLVRMFRKAIEKDLEALKVHLERAS